MPLGSESSSVQRPFVRYAVAADGARLSPLFTALLHPLLTARLRLPEFLNAKAPRRQDAREEVP